MVVGGLRQVGIKGNILLLLRTVESVVFSKVMFFLRVLFFTGFPLVLCGQDLLDYLKAYEGRWVGDFTLHSTATGYTESFAVEQRYWLDGGKLHGLAVSERAGGIESSSSVTYPDETGKKLITEVTRGDTVEMYLGVLHEGVILWLPANGERANDHQIRESLVEIDGVRRLVTEGFDTYVYADGLAHIVYKGDLVLQVDLEPSPEVEAVE